MKRPRPNLHKPGTLAALLALFLLAGAAVHAQTGGGYDLTWNTLDGGGATFSAGGDYQLGGTLGQPRPDSSRVAVMRCPAASGSEAERRPKPGTKSTCRHTAPVSVAGAV